MQNKIPVSVISYYTRPGNEMGLFYNAAESKRGTVPAQTTLVLEQ